MADVLKFEVPSIGKSSARRIERAREAEFSFWPEVSQGLWVVSDSQPVYPANSQGRVLFEMMLILGTAAAIAVALSFFVGAPPV